MRGSRFDRLRQSDAGHEPRQATHAEVGDRGGDDLACLLKDQPAKAGGVRPRQVPRADIPLLSYVFVGSAIHLKFEGNGNWPGIPEGAISDFAKNYNGSAPEKTVIMGLEYFKTNYEYGGQKQTMMIAKKNGNKITITLVGTDYDKNPDIPKIVETISIK